MKRLALALLLVGSLFSVGAAAEVRGSPELHASLPDDTVVPGSETTLRVTVTNDGTLRSGERPALDEMATTARGVDVSLDAGGAPIEIDTGSRSIGRLRAGDQARIGFDVTVPEDAAPGTYALDLTATYEYYGTIDTGGTDTRYVERTRTRHFDLSVEVDDRAAFAVVATDADVRVGSVGTVNVTMRNVGSEAANATRVRLASEAPALRFGGTAEASRFAGDWAPGETRTLSYQVAAAPDAAVERHAVTAVATFEDDDGVAVESDRLGLGVVPRPEQTFRVVATERDVAVGEDGTVSLTLRNDGPLAVTDATVTVGSPRHLRVAGGANATRFLGDWAPGERRTVTYELRATEAAEPRNYSLPVSVGYRDADGDRATERVGPVGVRPAAEPTTLAVEPVNATLGIDAANAVRVRVRNVGDERLTDVRARLAVEDPYESDNPTSYVDSLAPGESTTMTFELTTPEDGVPTRDAIPLAVTADTPDDERVTYDGYYVPVTISDAGGATRLLPIVGVGAAALAALGGAWWWYER
ncbi:COG1361 S-layer family protein [Halobellus rubicundus]|uniref:CARDB domain-containing protein n=1 Tax=Halobellus rubicundus TaxID=2996466 RepID=A0ABD5MD01_9EURY